MITIRPCGIEHLDALCELGRRTYFETFDGTCASSDLDAYLESAFAPEKLRGELTCPGSSFSFIERDGELAGYLKLNEASAQTDVRDERSLEIERIYVAKEHHGAGLGTRLMEHAIETARARDKEHVWLGVWQENGHAIRFYERHGFYKIGTHTFVVGTDAQTDWIMRKDLVGA